ncbi:MAG TPA: hypothetical protein VKR42_13965, partial [Ktedonobacteraceae bacterium]|nr:hypothetical protein [Ktedonobacteraceae bacterium]
METTSQPLQVDTDRQQKARAYALLRRRLSFTNMGIVALAFVFIFWTGLDVGLRDQLVALNWQPLAGWYPLQVLVFFLVL